MIKVYYINLNDLCNGKIGSYLRLLPSSMQKKLMQRRNLQSLKSSLLSRVIIFYLLARDNIGLTLEDWQVNKSMKPFIKNWKQFNISHSGDYVVVAVADSVVGIDIELITELEWQEITTHFTFEEQQYIFNSQEPVRAFYQIWVKKEAILKAIGTGIINGLGTYDCTQDKTVCENVTYNFHSIDIAEQYICVLASSLVENSISIQRFLLDKIRADIIQ